MADVRCLYRSLSTVRCSLTKPPPRLASHVGLGFHGVGHRAPRMGAGRLHPLPSVPQSGSRSAVIRAYEVDAGLFECVLNRFDGACFQDGPTSRTASRHAALSDPGESDTVMFQSFDADVAFAV